MREEITAEQITDYMTDIIASIISKAANPKVTKHVAIQAALIQDRFMVFKLTYGRQTKWIRSILRSQLAAELAYGVQYLQ